MTFWQYLQHQKDRDDFIGDVARDALADRTFPRRDATYHRLNAYLVFHGACREALIGLAQAYREWQHLRRRVDKS